MYALGWDRTVAESYRVIYYGVERKEVRVAVIGTWWGLGHMHKYLIVYSRALQSRHAWPAD